MRQPQGLVRYGGAYATPVRRRTTKKEPWRSPRPTALEERIEEIMDRVHRAGDDQVERVDLKQAGVGLVVAVPIDATVIRSVLPPSPGPYSASGTGTCPAGSARCLG